MSREAKVMYLGIGDLKWVIYYPNDHLDRYKRNQHGEVAPWPTQAAALKAVEE